MALTGQDLRQVKLREKQLSKAFIDLRNIKSDSVRILLNDSVQKQFYELLIAPSASRYSFDSLTTIARLFSDDGRIAFFQWNLQENSGKHHYFGFLRINDERTTRIVQLTDRSGSIEEADTLILKPENWYGALYYKLIPMITANQVPVYTLLGWSGKNNRITSKVIDILSFNSSGEPLFGLPVFKNYLDGRNSRVIYQYSATTSMSLKFEQQIVSSTKKWNARTREFDVSAREDWLIVADRLEPLDPMLVNQYQFYVPSGDIHDGFLMEGSTWKFKKGIESRNKTK